MFIVCFQNVNRILNCDAWQTTVLSRVPNAATVTLLFSELACAVLTAFDVYYWLRSRLRCVVCVTICGLGGPDIEYYCWPRHGTAMLRVGDLR